MTSNTLAGTAVRLAALVLTRDRSAAHQCFRVKNLHEQEVVQFVGAWPEAANKLGLEKVRLIVADSLNGKIAEQYVAEAGCSITHYRNNNPDGLIYVETSVQSDEQGLQNMFSLRDSNFLDGSFDDYAPPRLGVAGLLIERAWMDAGGQSNVPALLIKGLLEVIGFVHPDIEPVPVRRFVALVELACQDWIQSNRTRDAAESDRIVGQALSAMDMFPDPNWKEGNAEARTRRRLELNARHADLIDGGKELDADEVVDKAKATQFKDETGGPLTAEEVGRWRDRCSAYGMTPTAELRRQIPYWVFRQLFAKDTAGLQLGDRVRVELERAAPERLSEFDSLDVTTGINLRISYDANRFLEAVSEGGAKPFADLIEQATRKSVERLAVPPRKRFFNPAIEIVRLVKRVTADHDVRVASVRVEVSPEAVGSPSHGLFAFLFGGTVKAIADALTGLPGACELLIQPELIDVQAAPALRGLEEAEDEEESETLTWSPLPLRIILSDPAGRVLEVTEQIEWSPSELEHFALFWLLVAADDSPALGAVAALRVPTPVNGNDWMGPLVRRELSLDSLKVESGHVADGPHALLEDLVGMRLELRGALRSNGLDIATLRSFLDKWQEVVAEARQVFVPDGVRSRELDAFLGCDMLVLGRGERRIMLPVHPLRLRWICCYLEETRKLAQAFLSGEAAFADGEGETFLDWLENLTPRESPPLAVGHDGQLLYSKSEVAWFEDFSPERTETGDVGFDSDAVETIARRIVGYLDTHPHKRDGLSLLVVLPTSDAMPAEILRRILVRANRSVRVSLHVAAPRARWESIARAVELISEDSDSAPRARLFPDRDLALIDYQAGGDMTDLLADLQLDIAVVTHVLQAHVLSQQNTESPIQRPGHFDPLQHRPLRLETRGGGRSISLVMLPKYPDPMLESWSTLAVRANRCMPVAPGQPENTDLVELRINFQDSARLFKDLHEHCHWVITLERHISREQIESVEAGAPDVLSIEEGVGANRLSTLMVSSRSGRALAQARVVKKLARLIPAQQIEGDTGLLPKLAEAIYDSTRSLSPRLALQALGVARVTEEIIGLTIARRLTEDRFPAGIHDGLSAWLSLDDHTDWFGGHAQVRADMCRISIERDPSGVLDVDVLVLEGKLRQLFDEHGIVQVRRTREFFTAILSGTGSNGVPKVDAAMWLELIASAIETLGNDAVTFVPATGLDTRDEMVRRRDLLLSDFRTGKFRLRNIGGVYSACMWESEDEALTMSVEPEVTVLKSTRVHLLDLVRPRDCDEVQAAPSVTNTEQGMAPREVPTLTADNLQGQAYGEDGAAPSTSWPAPVQADQDLPAERPIALTAGTFAAGTVRRGPPDVSVASVSSTGLRRGLSDSDLQRRYEEILGCFATHGVQVSAAQPEDQPFVEGPSSVLFKVRPGSGIDPRKLSEKSSALKLVLALDQEQNVSFNIDKGFVTVDVPKRQEHRYFVDAAETWSRWARPNEALAVPLGEDRFGAVVEFNFSSPNSPHLLVAGTTGSGKSEALNTILFGLVHHYSKDELRLMLVDPKGTELVPFADSPYLEGKIGWDDTDALDLLERAVTEMQRRYLIFKSESRRSMSEFNAAAAPSERLPWWLIVLDEYADLTGEPQAKKDIEAQLKRLAQKARAAGIHVIIATQKPSAEVISTNLRSNLPAQLALRVKSATESRVVMDEAGAENLNGKGDAILKAEGKLRRVQCSRVNRT